MVSEVRKSRPTFLLLVAIAALSGWICWHGGPWSGFAAFSFIFSGCLIGVCLHEFGHALVAYLGGDTSVKDKGYLSLDVFHYADATTTFVLPMLFLLLGGVPLPGGAVYINRNAIPSAAWRSLMSAAGVLTNAIMLVPVIIAFHLWSAYGSPAFWGSVAFFVYVEILAILINLIPLPPLDGYGVVESILPAPVTGWVRNYRRQLMIVPFVLLLFPNPVLSFIWQSSEQLLAFLSIPLDAVGEGYAQFAFWKQ